MERVVLIQRQDELRPRSATGITEASSAMIFTLRFIGLDDCGDLAGTATPIPRTTASVLLSSTRLNQNGQAGSVALISTTAATVHGMNQNSRKRFFSLTVIRNGQSFPAEQEKTAQHQERESC